ncbi:hypothetical protein BGW39_001700 [Mortierella sp. 14UC]|nr:hypothetical protein BGW39_001700 [Mortierella sp. 14UC]
MSLFRSPSSRRPKPSAAPRSTSPLNIPEILELIFFFLDHSTLRRAAALVCQQWFRMNQHRLLRTVIWDSAWNKPRLDAASSRMVGAGRAHCYLHMADDIIRIDQGDLKRLLVDPLKELCVDILTGETDYAINNNLLCINTLTSLALNFYHKRHYTVIICNLSSILRNCPALKYFEGHGTVSLTFTWTPFVVGEQPPLLLRSLVLGNLSFSQDGLHNLLAFAPKLKVLQLTAMPENSATGLTYGTDDWLGLLAYLQSLPITLDTIHLSTAQVQTSTQVLQRMMEICPMRALTAWNLWACDLVSQSIFRELALHTNRLTTLDLLSRHSSSGCCQTQLKDAPMVLHRFLSTASSDMFVHLRTLKTIARLEDLDLFCRANRVTTYDMSGPLNPLGVWRCRGLKTLHIEMHGAWDHLITGSVNSRIIFGYISRVVPLLEELRITAPLERLSVRPEKYSLSCLVEEFDLNWMTPSGQSIMNRFRRRQELKFWNKQGRQQQNQAAKGNLEAEQVPRQLTEASGKSDVALDAEILGQLRHLGLVEDVAEMLIGMDSSSYRPLPALEGLAITRPYFNQPEDEIAECSQEFNRPWRFRRFFNFK